MSELKARHVVDVYDNYAEHPCGDYSQVYLKSEVDKVIAEKDEEIRRLRRALWVTRTAMAKSEKDRWNSHIDCGTRRNRKDPAFVKTGKLLETSEWRKLWADNERKNRPVKNALPPPESECVSMEEFRNAFKKAKELCTGEKK